MKDYYGAIRLKVRRIKAVTSLRLYTHSRRQSESQLEYDQYQYLQPRDMIKLVYKMQKAMR